ncbi:MFS transporter [Thermoactinomyces daqus]|uniref:MFS transporter n=1 Tax=Thermoactinomyces daqus TaxID=1329516 RepID=A0A7W2AGD2_9BACL|nr:MFS transporter [Thermoactinomyces daqus]
MSTKHSVVENAPLTSFHKRLTLYTSGGPFLDGYILSIIGVALTQIEPEFHLNAFWTGMIGASTLVGFFLGGLVFGYVTDLIGRHVMYTIDLVVIMIFSVWQAFADGPLELSILRFLLGIAVGADYPIATSLLAEFAPRKHRGGMLGVLQASWYLGALVAYLVGYLLLLLGSGAWRWMLASSALPAFILIFMRKGTPESPRWLLKKNRIREAREVLQEVYGTDADIHKWEAQGKKTRFNKLFQGGYLIRTTYIGLFWMITIIPSFAIYTFGPEIMESINLNKPELSFIGTAVISFFFFIGNIPALLLLYKIGRRPLIIVSFLVMALGLLLVGLFPKGPIWITIIGFVIYAFFTGGPSVLTWIYPNELFPTEVRATAVGVATAISRVGSFIGTFLLPYALRSIGIGPTVLIGAGLTFIGVLISIAWAPETKGKTLAEASTVE